MIDLGDITIRNGIVLKTDPRIELDFLLSGVEETEAGKTVNFPCRYSNADTASPDVDKEVVTGWILMLLGTEDEDLLLSRTVPSLLYFDLFVPESIKKRLSIAAIITKSSITNDYMINPGTLDSVFQGMYVAFTYPNSGQMCETYLPRSFRCIRLDIGACRRMSTWTDPRSDADCYVTDFSARDICGSTDVFCAADGQAVQHNNG
ncbi:hypothetical protein M426DRAFT_15456 [Hypoxylon sp. CI-4A]|nr:hypothetical protein M426DRAFT_15456 [Hypoxylon sp. CI-4A]